MKTISKSESASAPALPSDAVLDFSVILVSYNVREFLRQALLSIRRALAGLSAEIIVVDNASEDGSADMVLAEFSDVRLIENPENLGFASANNQALKQVHGRIVVLLNPDTVVQENTFIAVRDFFESQAGRGAGMVGCKILNPDGTLQLACRRSFPTPWVAFTRLSGLSALFPRSRLFGKYNLTYLDADAVAEVEAISGSFMAVRREVLTTVGLLDERFFLYGEDLDWCFRLRAAGWKIYYVPQTQIIHFKGESSKRSNLDSVRVFYQAMHIFARKHFRARLSVAFYWLLLAAIWSRGVLSALKKAALATSAPLVDLLLMQAALGLGIYVRFGNLDHARAFVIVAAVYSLVWLFCLDRLGCYGHYRFSPYQAFLATTTGFLINASLTYFFKQYAFSRAVLLIAAAATIVLLSAWRLLAKVRHWFGLGPFRGTLGKTLLRRRTVIVGDFVSGESILPKLTARVDSSYELIGLVSLKQIDVGREYNGLTVLATLQGLDDIIRRRRIQEVIFSTQGLPFDRVLDVIARRRDQRVTFKLAPANLDVIIGKATIDQLNDVPLVDIEYRLERRLFRTAKRALDLAVATFVILMLAMPFLMRWLLSTGRLTRRYAQAGQTRVSLWELQRPDRRGTPLDRLPYLFAVISGRISLVGCELTFDAHQPATAAAAGLPPGLTGLVQLKRQPGLPVEEKEKLHLFYATHYSPLLDLEILLRALFRL